MDIARTFTTELRPDRFRTVAGQVIGANPGRVETYRKNPKVIDWFVGEVMKATRGQANPQVVNEVLKQKLDS